MSRSCTILLTAIILCFSHISAMDCGVLGPIAFGITASTLRHLAEGAVHENEALFDEEHFGLRLPAAYMGSMEEHFEEIHAMIIAGIQAGMSNSVIERRIEERILTIFKGNRKSLKLFYAMFIKKHV